MRLAAQVTSPSVGITRKQKRVVSASPGQSSGGRALSATVQCRLVDAQRPVYAFLRDGSQTLRG
jgi:hypothetical protein